MSLDVKRDKPANFEQVVENLKTHKEVYADSDDVVNNYSIAINNIKKMAKGKYPIIKGFREGDINIRSRDYAEWEDTDFEDLLTELGEEFDPLDTKEDRPIDFDERLENCQYLKEKCEKWENRGPNLYQEQVDLMRSFIMGEDPFGKDGTDPRARVCYPGWEDADFEALLTALGEKLA